MGQTKKQRLLATAKPARNTAREPSMGTQGIEAFFLHCYAQMNMTAMAMKAVGPKGFSLTKLRILGFATLTPGLTVGELVQYIRVTHQSVNEPLRQLINEGYVVAKIGVKDRRHKRLFATRKGLQRYMRNVRAQARKFEDAFRATGSGAASSFLEVQRRLVQPSDREWIVRALAVAGKHVASG
jgi:DNA-binding MarR family transcriptional regulator